MGNQCSRCLDLDELNKEIFIEDGIVFDTENSFQFEIEKESLISEEQRFVQQKSLFHYFTSHYLLEMFDNFDLFNDQMKELKQKSSCKLYHEKNKFDNKMQGFWCEFIDQDNTKNRTCFTPAMITLFNMNMDLEINKKVNDQLEEFEIFKIEKKDNYVIFVIKQKTIKSFLNSSKYFFNVLIYKRNNEGVYQRIVTSVQLTELFKDEYFKQFSDSLNPQMLTLMNIQKFTQDNDDILITDSSRIDPLNQVGFKLAKGFMKKVFKKYAYDYKIQLVEFIINQKKKGLNQNIIWFNNDEKEIKNIIKENFDLIDKSNVQIDKLSEEVRILYENKSMINSDLLDSENLSDIQEIQNSKSEFKLFDYTLQQGTTNKIDSFDIENADMSPIKLNNDQISKKERDDKIIKFFQQNQTQKTENKETPFSIQNSEVFNKNPEIENQIKEKDMDQINQEIENSKSQQIIKGQSQINNNSKSELFPDDQNQIQQSEQFIIEKIKQEELKDNQSELEIKDNNNYQEMIKNIEQEEIKNNIIDENKNDAINQSDKIEDQKEHMKKQDEMNDKNEDIDKQDEINDNIVDIKESVKIDNINESQIQQDKEKFESQNQNLNQIKKVQDEVQLESNQFQKKIIEKIQNDIEINSSLQSQEQVQQDIKNQSPINQQNEDSNQNSIKKEQQNQQENIDDIQVQDNQKNKEQKNVDIINDSFLSNQIPSNEQIIEDQNKQEDIMIKNFTQNFINDLIDNVVKAVPINQNQQDNIQKEVGQYDSTNLNSIDDIEQQQQMRLQQKMDLIEEKGGSFEDIDN